jgi:hypothetical protein
MEAAPDELRAAQEEARRWKEKYEKEHGHRESVQAVAEVVMNRLGALESELHAMRDAITLARARVPTVQKDAENVAAWCDPPLEPSGRARQAALRTPVASLALSVFG